MRRSFAQFLVALVLVAVLPAVAWQAPSAAATTRAADGLTSSTAAASCWEIKQNQPTAGSGVYWLVTPALQAPRQFYCDQTTDGGGWVLVGRGREGWKPWYNGLGSAENLRTNVTGTSAFSPAQLPSQTVDGLLNNGPVSGLADGIRLRRATNTAGTTWQEVRFKQTIRTRWAWTFAAINPVGSYTFDGAGASGGTTSSFGQDQSFRRVTTTTAANQSFLWGFAFGTSVVGTNAASSYIWSASNNLGGGRPFTQMYVRPKLTRDALFTASIPDAGTAAQAQRALPDSNAQRTTWGVSGLADGIDTELHTEVSAFAQVGSTVYVGGNFASVQKDSAGTGKVARSYLTGFNVDSADLVTGFTPTFDGQVRALAALPDGRLAVGGDFTTVNGIAQPNLAFLDAATGTLSGSQVLVESRNAASKFVRGLSVRNGYLYVAGQFTHLSQGAYAASAWNGGRINLSTGRPDIYWNPKINGTTAAVDASAQGDRVYYSGYFTTVQGATAPKVSAVSQAANAPLALAGWTPRFSTTVEKNQYQQAVGEIGNRFYYGGSQHFLAGYDRTSLQPTSGSITLSGGDIQAISGNNGVVYAGCHCGDFNYQDAYTWPTPTGFTQADSINLLGAWDATSGTFLQDFNPITQARRGYGAWALFTDSNGTLWAGGDFQSSIRANYVNQWSGGFIRFAQRDAQAPSSPSNLTATTGDLTSFKLSWDAAADNSGKVGYEVLEDTRVIASTSTTSATIDRVGGTHRYFVRAVDAAGNRSASTPVLQVTGPDPADPPAPPAAPAVTGTALSTSSVRLSWPAQSAAGGFVVYRDGTKIATPAADATGYDDSGLASGTTYSYTVVARDAWGQSSAASSPASVTTRAQTTYVGASSTWRWRFASTAPDSGWTGVGYDDSSWASGTGSFGFGTTLANNDIGVGAPSPRPLSAQYRTTFQVDDVNAVASDPTMTFVADDGLAVYVNGVEVGRQNLPAGTLTSTTYASSAPRSASANINPVVLTIPRSALVTGTNVVTAEMHVNYRNTPDSLFRLSLASAQ